MSNFSELINSTQPVLVDFYADWCGPCKVMVPELIKLAEKVNGKAKVIKVNVDKNPDAAMKFGIRGVPTLILFKNGEIKWRQSGIVSSHHLEQVINQNM
jgi:thioredoxin 1